MAPRRSNAPTAAGIEKPSVSTMRPRTGSSAPPPRAASGRSKSDDGAAGVLRRHVARPRPRPASSPVARAIAGGRACSDARAVRAGHRQLGAHRVADVQLGRVQRHRHAERLQPARRCSAPAVSSSARARLAHQRDEPVEQRPRLVEPNGLARRGFECLVLEHRRSRICHGACHRYKCNGDRPRDISRRHLQRSSKKIAQVLRRASAASAGSRRRTPARSAPRRPPPSRCRARRSCAAA